MFSNKLKQELSDYNIFAQTDSEVIKGQTMMSFSTPDVFHARLALRKCRTHKIIARSYCTVYSFVSSQKFRRCTDKRTSVIEIHLTESK